MKQYKWNAQHGTLHKAESQYTAAIIIIFISDSAFESSGGEKKKRKGIYVYTPLIHAVLQQKHNTVKQL